MVAQRAYPDLRSGGNGLRGSKASMVNIVVSVLNWCALYAESEMLSTKT
jgi:hypothetical protein